MLLLIYEKEIFIMAKKQSLSISSPLLYIILGALLVLFKNQMLGWAMTIAGIFFIVTGVMDVLKKNLSSGIVNLFIGVAIIAAGWLIAGVVLLVLGLFIAFRGVMDLLAVLKLKSKGLMKFLSPVLTIIVGLALAFGNGVGIIITVVGVLLILDGVLALLGRK